MLSVSLFNKVTAESDRGTQWVCWNGKGMSTYFSCV
jgi:hypothetical protein